MSDRKRKICVVVASRANYGRVKYLMKAIKEHKDLELQLIVGASTLLDRFGSAIKVIKQDGFKPDREIHYVVEGEILLTQAKSTGMGIIELATAFNDLKPDAVVTVADRFETMATAIAASYLNIPLIHIQGGEVSGNIDDRVRHAITKLSDYHYVATEKSRDRVIKMGESPETVFNSGCPAMDVIANFDDLSINNKYMSKYGGVGFGIDWEKPYILMVQHPVTTNIGYCKNHVESTLYALLKFEQYQKVVLWPNADAGSDEVSKGLRVFREQNKDSKFHFFKNFSPEDYIKVMKNSSCLVGNSSSFLREGSFLGIPAVCVGDRQNMREHGKNCIFCDYSTSDIIEKLEYQLKHGIYDQSQIFGKGNAGKLIANSLAEINLKRQKTISY